MTKIKQLEKKISKLAPNYVDDLEQYIDFLLQKNKPISAGRLKQNWAGGLKHLKNKFTSIELQKKALEWRSK